MTQESRALHGSTYEENDNQTERKSHKNRIIMKTCHKFSSMRHVIIFNLSLLAQLFSVALEKC